MNNIIEKARNELINTVKEFNSDPYKLLIHVPEVEKWAKYMIKKYPKLDKEVLLLSAWLHDIGHYVDFNNSDHAIKSEKIAQKFLEKNNYPEDKTKQVLHCVRAHRCRDVIPESFEAKTMTFIDSASHITAPVYFNMIKEGKEMNCDFYVYAKMERDINDLNSFPEIKEELIELFNAWKNVVKAYDKLDF